MRSTQDGPSIDTRDRLLDAAEELFAKHGYSDVSTRTIADEAKANSAAVHYHFGSKEALLDAVFRRRLDPLNQVRIERIKACFDEPGGKADIEELLKAFLEPPLALPETDGERYFRLLAGRASNDPNPDVKRILFGVYDAVGHSFVEAVIAACPHLDKEELFWRVACIYGAMLYIRADNGRLQAIFGEEYSLSKGDGAMRYAIPFLIAGMRSGPVGSATTSTTQDEKTA